MNELLNQSKKERAGIANLNRPTPLLAVMENSMLMAIEMKLDGLTCEDVLYCVRHDEVLV